MDITMGTSSSTLEIKLTTKIRIQTSFQGRKETLKSVLAWEIRNRTNILSTVSLWTWMSITTKIIIISIKTQAFLQEMKMTTWMRASMMFLFQITSSRIGRTRRMSSSTPYTTPRTSSHLQEKIVLLLPLIKMWPISHKTLEDISHLGKTLSQIRSTSSQPQFLNHTRSKVVSTSFKAIILVSLMTTSMQEMSTSTGPTTSK